MDVNRHSKSGPNGADEYHVDGFAFLGRTLAEYRDLFDLDLSTLTGKRVLDCPSGPSSFVAEARERGIDAIGADIAYDRSAAALDRRGRAAVAEARSSIEGALDLFTIDSVEAIDAHVERRAAAHRRFLLDYATNGERYVHAELPDLPFPDDSFDVVCSAHLCFLYGDRLDREFHVDAIRELCRVARREVRLFPLVRLGGEPCDHVEPVVSVLEREGHRVERCEVPYEFLRGANELLRVVPRASRAVPER